MRFVESAGVSDARSARVVPMSICTGPDGMVRPADLTSLFTCSVMDAEICMSSEKT